MTKGKHPQIAKEVQHMNRLTKEREARGWSRAELARRAHMCAADVGKIESGRLRPYEAQRQKLSRALRLTPPDADRLFDVE